MATQTQNKLVVRRQGEEVQLGSVESLVKGDVVRFDDDKRMMYMGDIVGTDSLILVGRIDKMSIACLEVSKSHVSTSKGYLSRLPSNFKRNFIEKFFHKGTSEYEIANYALQQGGF